MSNLTYDQKRFATLFNTRKKDALLPRSRPQQRRKAVNTASSYLPNARLLQPEPMLTSTCHKYRIENTRSRRLTLNRPASQLLIATHALLTSIVSLLTVSRPINSLFKVLFIFPSQYLFAIGLVPIFSFRWNLPPILDCNPKQSDSSNAHRNFTASSHGILTLYDVLFQGTLLMARKTHL